MDQPAGGQLGREVARLAVPPFVTLIAEPLFLLADAAVAGGAWTSPPPAGGGGGRLPPPRGPALAFPGPPLPRVGRLSFSGASAPPPPAPRPPGGAPPRRVPGEGFAPPPAAVPRPGGGRGRAARAF